MEMREETGHGALALSRLYSSRCQQPWVAIRPSQALSTVGSLLDKRKRMTSLCPAMNLTATHHGIGLSYALAASFWCAMAVGIGNTLASLVAISVPRQFPLLREIPMMKGAQKDMKSAGGFAQLRIKTLSASPRPTQPDLEQLPKMACSQHLAEHRHIGLYSTGIRLRSKT